MKKILFILIIFIVACKKDKTDDPIIPDSPADSILYLDFTDKVVNSITGHVTHPSGFCSHDVPVDTIVADSIDIDSSGGFDYIFRANNYMQTVSISNPCFNYNYNLQINSINQDDFITVDPQTACVKTLQLGETIDANLNYNQTGYICRKMYMTPGCSISGEYYLGIKRKIGNGISYGWIKVESLGNNGVIIKESAVNITLGNSITAGQTQ